MGCEEKCKIKSLNTQTVFTDGMHIIRDGVYYYKLLFLF